LDFLEGLANKQAKSKPRLTHNHAIYPKALLLVITALLAWQQPPALQKDPFLLT
jgi:hypothetical protein